ncbi:hypothetical protein C3M26_21680 [Salmonella enterica]|nr:hypothetical protein [Salmonella enterica]
MTIKIKIIFMLFSLPFLFSSQVNAASPSTYSGTPPKFVYRVDSRRPDEIFQNGFEAWGNNYNLIAHVNGASCSTSGSQSGFISTTSNLDAANAIAEQHVAERGVAYIYTIRADNTFYNAAESIDWLHSTYNAGPYTVMSLEMARRAGEWDAVDRIPPENIQQVSVLRGLQVSTAQNPRYLNVQSSGNQQLYTRNAAQTLGYYGFDVSGSSGFSARLTSCFASCSGAASYSEKRSVYACSSQPEKIKQYDPNPEMK